jgi:hypothetical protein
MCRVFLNIETTKVSHKFSRKDEPYLKRTAKKKATTGRTLDIADDDVAEA